MAKANFRFELPYPSHRPVPPLFLFYFYPFLFLVKLNIYSLVSAKNLLRKYNIIYFGRARFIQGYI